MNDAPKQLAEDDCFRTCVAAILGLHPREVPHLRSGRYVDAERVNEWLGARGFALASFWYSSDAYDGVEDLLSKVSASLLFAPMILTAGTRGGNEHSVIVRGGRVVFDPWSQPVALNGPCGDGRYWTHMIVAAGTVKRPLLARLRSLFR